MKLLHSSLVNVDLKDECILAFSLRLVKKELFFDFAVILEYLKNSLTVSYLIYFHHSEGSWILLRV